MSIIPKLLKIETLIENQPVPETYPRSYLGMSMLNHACARYMWYYFRWTFKEHHSLRLKRIFERGDLEEIRVIRDLQSVGVIVNGEQNEYSHGHFIRGHNDGLLRNVPDLPDEEVLLEIKTAKDSKFKEFQKKKDVKKVHPVYYGQLLVYMYKRNISNALFIVTNKDTEERYYEIIGADHDFARELLGKAEDITRDANPPAKLSESPSWFECKYCSAKEVCHYGKTPETNCRTCEHSATRDSEGNDGWWCTLHKRSIDEKSCEPCENHTLLTSLSN